MGIMDMIRNELIEIIEWLDADRSTLAWRFPRVDNEIKNGAELIVREGQEAVFVYRGAMADRYGPGNHKLVSENMPILGTLQGWKHGFNSPFRSEVYYISTRPAEVRWGTPQPITVRDPDFRMIQVRANGLCMIKVADPEIFLKEIIGTESSIEVEEITEILRRVIAQAFQDMIVESKLGAIDLQGQGRELAGTLTQYVQERVDDEYGLEILSIDLTISLPEEVQQAINKGAARGAEVAGTMHQIGDMNTYGQFAQAEAMQAAANNPGGSGGMGEAMGMGMGLAMANQMAGGMGGGQAAAPPPPASAAFHVDNGNGQTSGPFSPAQLQAGAANGQINAQTLVWNQALGNWTPAGQVPALASIFAAPPPPPPSAAQAPSAAPTPPSAPSEEAPDTAEPAGDSE